MSEEVIQDNTAQIPVLTADQKVNLLSAHRQLMMSQNNLQQANQVLQNVVNQLIKEHNIDTTKFLLNLDNLSFQPVPPPSPIPGQMDWKISK